MTEKEINVNQQIDTTQPRPLRGLKIRGVKEVPTVNTVLKGEGPDGVDRYLTVNEEDYDKKKHGEKVDKLPSRKKASKKKAKKE